MIESGQITLDSQQQLCEGVPFPDYSGLVYRVTEQGHAIYTPRYVKIKDYVLQHVKRFNRRLAPHYRLIQIQGSQRLSMRDPLTQYYLKKFPTRYIRAVEAETQGCMRPATCANAFALFRNPQYGQTPTVIHQVGVCFRSQHTGQCRKLLRTKRFVMPDYHLILTPERVTQAFELIRREIHSFYQGLGLTQHCVQIYRTPNPHLPIPPEAWVQRDDGHPQVQPYYSMKYEVAYTRGHAPVQLGTIQIDQDMPRHYGLEGRVVLHFSMGSIERLIGVMEAQGLCPALGLSVILIHTPPDTLDWTPLAPYALEVRSVTGKHQLARAIHGSGQDSRDYPYVILVGPREVAQGTMRLLNRRSGTESILSPTELASRLSELAIVR